MNVRIRGKDFTANLVFDTKLDRVVAADERVRIMLNWNRVMVKRMCGWKGWTASIVK